MNFCAARVLSRLPESANHRPDAFDLAPGCINSWIGEYVGTQMSTLNTEGDLARAIEQIRVRGNLMDAQRVRELADRYRAEAVPFLRDATRDGSPSVVAAAIQALARVDPENVAERAFAILTMPGQDSDARAAAAEALSQVHSELALTVLIQATVDSPLVSDSAIRALHEHRSTRATVRIREHLRSILDDLGRSRVGTTTEEDEQFSMGRRTRAALGLLGLLVQRSYSDMEAELFSLWRTHPDIVVKAAAARGLLDGSIDNAYAVLIEGLPGGNEGYPHEPLGELENGGVRLILADAAYVVLLGASPSDAFSRLSSLFDVEKLGDWFGNKRAEIILLLLLGQVGWNPTSWLWGYADELHRRGVLPDARWQALGSRLESGSQVLQGLAAELRARLSTQAR